MKSTAFETGHYKKAIGLISKTTTSSNFFLISRFMEDVDTRITIFFSVFELRYRALEFTPSKDSSTCDKLNEME